MRDVEVRSSASTVYLEIRRQLSRIVGAKSLKLDPVATTEELTAAGVLFPPFAELVLAALRAAITSRKRLPGFPSLRLDNTGPRLIRILSMVPPR